MLNYRTQGASLSSPFVVLLQGGFKFPHHTYVQLTGWYMSKTQIQGEHRETFLLKQTKGKTDVYCKTLHKHRALNLKLL